MCPTEKQLHDALFYTIKKLQQTSVQNFYVSTHSSKFACLSTDQHM